MISAPPGIFQDQNAYVHIAAAAVWLRALILYPVFSSLFGQWYKLARFPPTTMPTRSLVIVLHAFCFNHLCRPNWRGSFMASTTTSDLHPARFTRSLKLCLRRFFQFQNAPSHRRCLLWLTAHPWNANRVSTWRFASSWLDFGQRYTDGSYLPFFNHRWLLNYGGSHLARTRRAWIYSRPQVCLPVEIVVIFLHQVSSVS